MEEVDNFLHILHTVLYEDGFKFYYIISFTCAVTKLLLHSTLMKSEVLRGSICSVLLCEVL